MSGQKVYTMPIYVQAPLPGAPAPHIIPPTPSLKAGYVWGYPVPQTVMQAPGPDGTYGWPIYVKGGTSSNPQFAYYPVPPSAAPPGAVPYGAVPQGPSSKHHRRRQAKESDDDDDEKCACHECKRGKGAGKTPAPPGASMPHPGQFMPAQFFGPPAATTQQTTTFIPYVVPSCSNHHCNSKSTGSNSTPSTGHKHHIKKESTSSYHYAENCDCPTCKARRMAIEMERIQEERKHEREFKDTREFIKMKKRVDREEREATLEEMYRAKKAGEKHVAFDESHMWRHMHPEHEAGYEWVAVPPGPFPITAFHPGGTTPITLQPIHHGPMLSELEVENARLRHEQIHLKDKIKRERSQRNKDDATRAFLSTRLHDLDQDVQELRKKACSTQGGSGVKAPIVEIQVPLGNEKRHQHHKKSASKDKGKDKEGGGSARNSADHAKAKTKNVGSKHKNPHVCYDSDCDNFDSCSECSFECKVKGCRTCRPRGGRR
ncbi:hypothetical protein TWF481_000029 [Arthrobotrys musiformis]|uniref:Uncharacterized protein n=1 Tax=Arthrobotrys musiformis TaxID=47236 RepID=A0AAV9WNE5_9PEZI